MTQEELNHIKGRIRTYIYSLKNNVELMIEGIDALDNIPEKDLEFMCDSLFNQILENNNLLDREMEDRYTTIGSQFKIYKNIKIND